MFESVAQNIGYSTETVIERYKKFFGQLNVESKRFHEQGLCPTKMVYKMRKLSAYTVTSNCADLTDIRDDIAEIYEAMKACVESGKRIPSFYVSRLAK